MKHLRASHELCISAGLAALLLLGGGVSFFVPIASVQSEALARPDPFENRLFEIAKDYLKYGRVDDEMRVAPKACAAPVDPKPGIARFSRSEDAETHGKKLYSVFVGNKWVYRAAKEQKEQPIGQVLVKQSWVAEEVKADKEK